MASILSRVKGAWNVFINKDPTPEKNQIGASYYYRPDRRVASLNTEKSTANSVYTRFAVDASKYQIRHVKVDEDDRYLENVDSGLNYCFKVEANIDETATAFVQNIVYSMLDDGVVAIVPIETDHDYLDRVGSDILTMRCGTISKWYPQHVTVKVYNELTGNKEEVTLPKSRVCIIENPFRAVMNEKNSNAQRLMRKQNLLDGMDEQSFSGKLDMIIQLPYTIKNPAKKELAEERRADIEMQLTNSKYGIAYIDGTEHITQLNRPVENNLQSQVEYLTNLLFSQLGVSMGILDGTASPEEFANYQSRIIKPIIQAITDELKRKFLTKTARTQGHSIMAFQNLFDNVTVNNVAEAADKLTRNEIVTSNEIRQGLGMKPAKDANADKLMNKNMPQDDKPADDGDTETNKLLEENQNEKAV